MVLFKVFPLIFSAFVVSFEMVSKFSDPLVDSSTTVSLGLGLLMLKVDEGDILPTIFTSANPLSMFIVFLSLLVTSRLPSTVALSGFKLPEI